MVPHAPPIVAPPPDWETLVRLAFRQTQAVRSRQVSRIILPLSVLWHKRQTEDCLILRSKPRNRRDDFEA
jgi:hypothetical protein